MSPELWALWQAPPTGFLFQLNAETSGMQGRKLLAPGFPHDTRFVYSCSHTEHEPHGKLLSASLHVTSQQPLSFSLWVLSLSLEPRVSMSPLVSLPGYPSSLHPTC